MKRYDDAIVVVTGASSGIGRRLAIDFAHRGGTVVGVARRESLLQELRDELRRSRDANDTVVCDVGNTDAFTEMLDGVMTRFGRIDVLVNNAGIEQPTPVVGAAMDLRPYRHMLDVNFLGAVAGTLAVVPGMLARGSGVIANVSSDVVRAPEPRESAYAATKAALSAFTESVAHEVASKGVHVHVIYPGWVPTAMGMSGIAPGDPLPPKLVRRTETEVSELVLDRLGGPRIEINAAWLPLLAPISRAILPRTYQRGIRQATARASTL